MLTPLTKKVVAALAATLALSMVGATAHAASTSDDAVLHQARLDTGWD